MRYPLVVDLMDGAAVSAMLPRILELTGRLDIFHANAGAYVGGPVADGDPDVWDRMLNLNINAAFRSIHAVLPHMIERKTGDIVLTSFDRRCRAGGVGADLHRLEVRGAGLRPHRPPPGVPRTASASAPSCPGPVVTALLDDWPKAKMDEALANGSLMQPRRWPTP